MTLTDRILALLAGTTSVSPEEIHAATREPVDTIVATLDGMVAAGTLRAAHVSGSGYVRKRYRLAGDHGMATLTGERGSA